MVRPLQLAAIRAFGVGRRAQRVMRAAHVAARWRGFLFRNGHDRHSRRIGRRSLPLLSQIQAARQQPRRRRCHARRRPSHCGLPPLRGSSRDNAANGPASRCRRLDLDRGVGAARERPAGPARIPARPPRRYRSRRRPAARRRPRRRPAGGRVLGLGRAVEQREPLDQHAGERVERHRAGLLEGRLELGAQQDHAVVLAHQLDTASSRSSDTRSKRRANAARSPSSR